MGWSKPGGGSVSCGLIDHMADEVWKSRQPTTWTMAQPGLTTSPQAHGGGLLGRVSGFACPPASTDVSLVSWDGGWPAPQTSHASAFPLTAELIQLSHWETWKVKFLPKNKYKRLVLKVKYSVRDFDRCCSNLWFNKQYQRWLLGQGFGTMGITQWLSLLLRRKIHVQSVSKGPIQKMVWGKNGAFMPTSTLMGREKGWTLGTYIFTRWRCGVMPGQWYSFERIMYYYLPSFFPFKKNNNNALSTRLVSKLQQMNRMVHFSTQLFLMGVSEILSPSYSYTARRMLVVDKWSQARWYA